MHTTHAADPSQNPTITWILLAPNNHYVFNLTNPNKEGIDFGPYKAYFDCQTKTNNVWKCQVNVPPGTQTSYKYTVNVINFLGTNPDPLDPWVIAD